MKKWILTALMVLGFSAPAFALDLNGARSSGVLGEKADGYVAVLKPSAEAQALANEVNARRKQEYQKISSENKQAPDVVGKVAAQQIISGLPSGAMYQGGDGSWKKK